MLCVNFGLLATSVCKHNTVVHALAKWSVVCLDYRAVRDPNGRGNTFVPWAGRTIKVTQASPPMYGMDIGMGCHIGATL